MKTSKLRRQPLPPVAININSLMDVLTVLLFFLVKSFSVSSVSVSPPKDFRLPSSVSKDKFEEGTAVVLSRDVLMMGDRVIAKLVDGRFIPKDVGPDQRTILPLKIELEKEYKKRTAIFANAGDLSILPTGKLIVQADKRLNFAVVKCLLYTAATTNFGDLQFIATNETQ